MAEPKQFFAAERSDRVGAQIPKILRRISSELHPFTQNGMKKTERRGMQCVPLLRGLIAIKSWRLTNRTKGRIVLVAHDWITNMGQMHANLVIAAREQNAFHQGILFKSLHHRHASLHGATCFAASC